ncbi:hypothetical protein FCY95_16175 [Escherichia coli]|uniref:Uncharacterized protein n=1 Tax=Escherichia coli TaxID=562 RepID=A0A7A6ZYI3_ECOLX|nr:hypothetical protein [Escherichia coli]MDN0547705.1 hypothetical protein [Escherichia coli]MDN2139631.1 hypothetical protein [Escherichia coli]MDN2143941.1 hypothetical protein [Escherichia coli]MDN2148854.1 hypothetical protein [Escherichia coli]
MFLRFFSKFDFYKKWFNILNFYHYVDFISNKNKKTIQKSLLLLIDEIMCFFCFFLCSCFMCKMEKRTLFICFLAWVWV